MRQHFIKSFQSKFSKRLVACLRSSSARRIPSFEVLELRRLFVGGNALPTLGGSSFEPRSSFGSNGEVLIKGWWPRLHPISGGRFAQTNTGDAPEELWNFTVDVFLANGLADPSFGSNGRASVNLAPGSADAGRGLYELPDGSLLITGDPNYGYGQDDWAVIKLKPNGTVDTSFGTGGVARFDVPQFGLADSVAQLDNGKLIVSGKLDRSAKLGIMRLHPNGSLDSSFGSNGLITVDLGNFGDNSVAYAKVIPATNGSFFIKTGTEYQLPTPRKSILLTVDDSGSITKDVRLNLGTDVRSDDVIVDRQGRMLVAGSVDGELFIIRYTQQGALDTTFANGGIMRAMDSRFTGAGAGIAITNDGFIYTGILNNLGTSILIRRINENGTLDDTFGLDGIYTVPFADRMGGNHVWVDLIANSNGDLLVGSQNQNWISRIVSLEPVLEDITILEDAQQQVVQLSGITAGVGESQSLRVSATSNDPSLIPDPDVAFLSASTTGSIGFTPLTDQAGVAIITVTVEDAGLDGDFSTIDDNAAIRRSFSVTVTPVDDKPSDILLSSNTVSENAALNTTVGLLQTKDPDPSETFTYSMITGIGDDDNAVFILDGAMVRSRSSFDFEVKSNYSIRVRSTDSRGLSTEKALAIVVTNINENPTSLSLSDNSISENAGINTIVGEFSTIDPDLADTFGYSLVSGTGDTDNSSFLVDGNRLRAAINFDYESKNTYSIRTRTTDAHGLFTEKTFLILVKDSPEIISITGTPGNDTFIATFIGYGSDHRWSVLRGSTVVFYGPVSTDSILAFDGMNGNDVIQVVGTATDDKFVLDSNRILVNGANLEFRGIESFRVLGKWGNDRLAILNPAVDGIISSFDGGSGMDSLETQTGENEWDVRGTDAGVLNRFLTFNRVETLQGGTGEDHFAFSVQGRLTGQVLGGEGADILDYSRKTNAHVVNIERYSATSTGGFAELETFIGSSNAFVADTFVGANQTSSWRIDQANGGTLDSAVSGKISFRGFENLFGGLSSDVFEFTPTGTISRSLIGGTAGGIIDIVDVSQIPGVLEFNLSTSNGVPGVLGAYSGFEQVVGNGVSGTRIHRSNNTSTTWVFNALGNITVGGVVYSEIPAIVGGPGSDTLVGVGTLSSTSSWVLNAPDAGSLDILGYSLIFSGINNLTGGLGDDEFEIHAGGSLSGNLNAGTGGGINTLSYATWSSAVAVNLQNTIAGNATAVSGVLSNIQLIIGGSGDDLLTSHATRGTILIGRQGNDTLVGGSQRDLLFGGLGSDLIFGGAGEDILVAGVTLHDIDRNALIQIYREWISTRTFTQRTRNIWGNGRPVSNEGNFVLNSDASDAITDTVFADNEVDSLSGGLNQDWFFVSLNDLNDLNSGLNPDRLDM